MQRFRSPSSSYLFLSFLSFLYSLFLSAKCVLYTNITSPVSFDQFFFSPHSPFSLSMFSTKALLLW